MLVALATNASAQENLPFGPSNYESDLQMFAPFDLDLDNMSDDQWSGYFFEYNKLYWGYTGERVTVGSPNVTEVINGVQVQGQFAEVIYRDNPQDEGDPPPPHLIQNTLQDVPPKFGFALGNRYELGYQDQGHGWLIGVLDGPELNQTEFYGFGRRADGGLPPFIDDDYTGPDDEGPPNRELITADPGLRAFGFGSVPILFETPPGYLVGFRDYLNFLAGATLGTQGGPLLYVGNYGLTQEPDTDDDTIPFFRLADDIDEDGTPAAGFLVDPVTGEIIFFTDFDDLHNFNVFFNSVTIHNRTETDGVELMYTHHLTNGHYQAKHKNNRLSISYGARFLQLYDQFRVDADGSILGRSFWDTSFTNNIVGPQVAFQWANQRQRWRLSADSRFMAGYNVANWDQIGLMGEELIPGALNRPLYARPTAFAHGLRETEISPIGELRLQASYHVTSSFALKLGYTGTYIGNVRRAAPSVRYFLPDMGYVDNGAEEIFMNGVDFGVEFVH